MEHNLKTVHQFENCTPPPPHKIDWHLTSPYNITYESHMEVMRTEEIFSHRKSSWLFKKFSLSVSLEMYREQYGEYEYWCYGVKG